MDGFGNAGRMGETSRPLDLDTSVEVSLSKTKKLAEIRIQDPNCWNCEPGRRRHLWAPEVIVDDLEKWIVELGDELDTRYIESHQLFVASEK
jgi:hypothetical protein